MLNIFRYIMRVFRTALGGEDNAKRASDDAVSSMHDEAAKNRVVAMKASGHLSAMEEEDILAALLHDMRNREQRRNAERGE